MVGGNARARGVADGRCMLGKADMHEPPPRGSVVFCLAFLPELRIVLLMHLAVVDVRVMIKAVHGVVGCSARRGAEQRSVVNIYTRVRRTERGAYTYTHGVFSVDLNVGDRTWGVGRGAWGVRGAFEGRGAWATGCLGPQWEACTWGLRGQIVVHVLVWGAAGVYIQGCSW